MSFLTFIGFGAVASAAEEIARNRSVISATVLRTRQLILESIDQIWPKDIQAYKISTAESFANFALTGVTPTLRVVGEFAVRSRVDQEVVDIHTALITLSKKMVEYIKAINKAKASGFQGIKLPDFRNDTLAMLALTIRSEQKLLDAGFQPPTIMEAFLRKIRDVASSVGSFVVDVGSTIAKPFIFVWDAFKVATYVAIGLAGFYIYTNYIRKPKRLR